MIPPLFFILSIIIFSSVGVVYAESNCSTDNLTTTCTSIVTVELASNCEIHEIVDPETYKCIIPPAGGSSSEPIPPSFSSSGHGRTGVGPNNSGVIITNGGLPPVETIIPKWIGIVVPWWNDDKISDPEFKNIITYLLDENIIPSDTVKPNKQVDYLSPLIKQLFMLWSNGNLAESQIVKIIDHYRHVGVW